MSAHRLQAVRSNHWVGNVEPLPGPDGLIWLATDDRLFGLDPVSGEHRVDQPKEAGPQNGYTVFTGCWPHVVRRRDAPPRATVSISERRVVICVDGRETGSVPLLSGFAGDVGARLGDRVAWIVHHPSRGKTPMRIVCLNVETQTWGPVHPLEFSTSDLAVSGQRIALFDSFTGRAHVYEPDRLLGIVQHVRSVMWGAIAIDGDEVAVASHRNATDPGAVVAVGWARVRDGAETETRRFALHTQGATWVTFLEGSLAIHQYADVTLVARDALRAAPSGDLMLAIEDLATHPPTPSQTARVGFVGATTGVGFVESAKLGRLRFRCRPEYPVDVGEVIALDDFEPGVVRKWHPLSAEPRPLDPQDRCLVPVPWSDVELLESRSHVSATAELLTLLTGPSLPEPDAAFCTSIRYGASLTDPDEDDEPVEDEDALRALDGTLERSGDLLNLLLDDEREVESELVALRPTLRFGGELKRLHLALEFYTRRSPSDRDLVAFAEIAERLLERGWGLNYEFEPPTDYGGCHVSLDSKPLGTSTRRLHAR